MPKFVIPNQIKFIAYLILFLILISNYSNFKGHPADWTPFTFLFGLITFIIYSVISFGFQFILYEIIENISNWLISKFQIRSNTTAVLTFVLILLPFLILVNFAMSYSSKPDLNSKKGKLRWEKEWTTRNEDIVEKKNIGLKPLLPQKNIVDKHEKQISYQIDNALNTFLKSNVNIENNILLSSIFDHYIDSLTTIQQISAYKSSYQIKIMHYNNPKMDHFWGIITFKNDPSLWSDTARIELYEGTWFVGLNNNENTKVYFLKGQHSAKSYCIERESTIVYLLQNIYLNSIPERDLFNTEISPLDSSFWNTKAFQSINWNNSTVKNIELIKKSDSTYILRPFMIIQN